MRHFLNDEPAPGIVTELEIVRRLLPTITTAEAGAVIKDAVKDSGRVVLAVAPSKENLAPVTEAGLRTALSSGMAATVEAWRDDTEGRELLPQRPTPGQVRAQRELPEIGVTVLTLSNGVEVWLKPTDFRNDQIAFTAYPRGGTSLASEMDTSTRRSARRW